MLKNLIGILALALMLSPAVALASNRNWDGGGDTGTDSWGTANNWSPDFEPVAADVAYLKGLSGSSSNITEVDLAGEVCASVLVGYGNSSTNDHTMIVENGGVLTVSASFVIACNATLEGVIHGYVTVEDGGTLTSSGAATYFHVTHPNGSSAAVSNTCIGRLDMEGGLIDFSGAFRVSRNYNSSGTGNHRGEVYLYGGQIYASEFLMQFNHTADPQEPDRWVENTIPDYMDITYGVMYIKGDRQTQITGYVNGDGVTTPLLEAFGGAGTVCMELVDLTGQGRKAGNGIYTKVYGIIPEPGTMLLAGFGVLLLLVTRRKR